MKTTLDYKALCLQIRTMILVQCFKWIITHQLLGFCVTLCGNVQCIKTGICTGAEEHEKERGLEPTETNINQYSGAVRIGID